MKIYVASSWRNVRQPEVVQALRVLGHDVYDFKNPPTQSGFHWSDIDPEWKSWTPKQFVQGLAHPRAQEGFESDMNALESCDACVLVLPCGRSAHLELGQAVGAGKKTYVLLDDPLSEPELMYLMCTQIVSSLEELRTIFAPPSRTEQFLACIRAKFGWLEEQGVRVGRFFLHPADVLKLAGSSDFDVNTHATLREIGIIGYLWGATVYESDLVPVNHIAIFPDDVDVKLIGSAACQPLGYHE